MRREVNKQQGMAAILVTMILAVVISVIVLGFAQVVRREQRNALDDQLSSQAYYAAESGVNIAQKEIKDNLNTGQPLVDRTECNNPATDYQIPASELVVGQQAEVTCLLINSRLPSLEYQKIDMHAVSMYIKSSVGNVGRIYMSWQASTGSTAVTGCPAAVGTFGSSWSCAQPLLRLDLVPVAGPNDPTSVANRQYTAFLYPTTGGGFTTYNANKNNIVAARCQTATGTLNPKVCTIAIDTSALGQQAFAARVMSVYGDSDLSVFATDVLGVTRRTLVEGQVLIDSTAKASDVLKRLQARMSLTTPVPDFGVTAAGGGVCKRYQKIGTDVSIVSGSPAFCSIP